MIFRMVSFWKAGFRSATRKANLRAEPVFNLEFRLIHYLQICNDTSLIKDRDPVLVFRGFYEINTRFKELRVFYMCVRKQ